MTSPSSPYVDRPRSEVAVDCAHDTEHRHLCKGALLCSDCCHDRQRRRIEEERRLAWGHGYFVATQDLALVDRAEVQKAWDAGYAQAESMYGPKL